MRLSIKIDLNIFLLQHKAIGIGHKFHNLDRPLPRSSSPYYIELEIVKSIHNLRNCAKTYYDHLNSRFGSMHPCLN